MTILAVTTRVKNRAHSYAMRVSLGTTFNGEAWAAIYKAYMDGYRQAAREARILIEEAQADVEQARYQQTPILLRKQGG